MSRNHWTNHEIERLRECFPVMSEKEIVLAFPRHPLCSIKSKAQDLRLHKRKRVHEIKRSKWQRICDRHRPVIFGFQNTAGLQ